MRRRRANLDRLEAELVEARYLAEQRTGQWKARAAREAAWLAPRVEAARALVPEAMR